MKPVVFLMLSLLLAACHDGRAALRPAPTQAETRSLLIDRKFDELDDRFGGLQRAYSDGDIPDVELREAFIAFEKQDMDLIPRYQAWVNHSPKSYVAHLARGIFFTRLAFKARGDAFSSDTSEAQFTSLHSGHEIAAREFETSLGLEHKPLLTYLYSIDIAMNSSGVAARRALLDKAIAIDPKSFVARERFLNSIRTAWGGSTEQMKAFLKECETLGFSPEQMKLLEARVTGDEAWVHQYRRDDPAAAVEAYVRAADLMPQRDCGSCIYLNWAAGLALTSKNLKRALDLYSRILAQDPRNIDALNGRGATLLQLNEGKLAAADFLQSAEMGNTYGQTMLGKMLLVGNAIPADRDAAIAWLTKAAEHGDSAAVEALTAALDKNRIILPAPASNL